jgi:hypothetical protein
MADESKRDKEMMDGPPWGYLMADGQFRELPKRPMVLGGLGPPPFRVELPTGEVRHIIFKPEEPA